MVIKKKLFDSSLFTLHFSLFTFHSSLFTLHFPSPSGESERGLTLHYWRLLAPVTPSALGV